MATKSNKAKNIKGKETSKISSKAPIKAAQAVSAKPAPKAATIKAPFSAALRGSQRIQTAEGWKRSMLLKRKQAQ